jgi:Ataxin-3
MESIFFEKVRQSDESLGMPLILSIFFQQEGSLCAQHCLNALLQGSYFTAVDLATLANNLDEAERQQMAESGVDSVEYRHFIEVIK